MKKICLLIIQLIFMFALCSSQNLTLPLWPDGIPGYKDSGKAEVWDTSDIIRVSNVQEPNIIVYLPAKRHVTGQAVLICPGGGYTRLAYDWEGTDIAKWLNSKGIAGIVLKYRLPVSAGQVIPHQSPLMDAQKAMRLVRYHSEEWNIDPNRIGIMGFSAGGHLASTLGTHFDQGNPDAAEPVGKISCRPDFMVLVYPVITMTKPFMHKGSRNALIGEEPDAVLAENYSNELQVKENTPPTFLVHAGDDTGVPVDNSIVFYQALIQKNIPAEMHIYPTGGHGFSLAIGKGHLSVWPDLCVEWMRSMGE